MEVKLNNSMFTSAGTDDFDQKQKEKKQKRRRKYKNRTLSIEVEHRMLRGVLINQGGETTLLAGNRRGNF